MEENFVKRVRTIQRFLAKGTGQQGSFFWLAHTKVICLNHQLFEFLYYQLKVILVSKPLKFKTTSISRINF